MDALAVALLIPLIKKLVDVWRFIQAKDFRSAMTQAVVWLIAISVTAAAARTNWAGDITLFNASLAESNFFSQAFLGMLLGSSASLAVDTIKAVGARAVAPPTPPIVVVVPPVAADSEDKPPA